MNKNDIIEYLNKIAKEKRSCLYSKNFYGNWNELEQEITDLERAINVVKWYTPRE